MEPVIRIYPEWDATLTYDDLEGSSNTGGSAFVGRGELLDIIVGAIRQPDRRGTFLVSGYRGAGKTTLLIEAIRRTIRSGLLPAEWTLLPLVLNASEVSAALPVAPPAREGEPAGVPLRIGPQELLTALIRTLRNYAETADKRTDTKLPDPLKAAIQETYRKAMAKEYSRTEGDQQQRSRTLTRDLEFKLTSADAYKSLSVAGAAAAVVIEGSAWLSSGAAAMHAVAVAVGALAVGSWTASRKLSMVAKQESTEAVSVKYDNSLQQLEGDLKELLSGLHTAKRRVVVVLEELDKIRDEDGEQLDAVIRYFKNLFTQAPALFFFVTDKAYYDFVAGRIRRARRERSYAIQHTFFTHRLFVGRPTTRDCLAFLKSITADEAAGKKLDSLYAPSGLPPFSTAIATDPFLRLVRYLLFKSSNHLFDLKNEVRRFIRTHGADLVIDTDSLSEDDVVAGVFQDLVVQKYNLFAFGDGRPYVNEVLNDCLYAVFNDLGSDAVQRVSGYYPRAQNAAPVPSSPAAAAVTALLGEDQLELSEQLRITAAVDSLIEDLQRGGAFEAERTNITQDQFVWKRTAAHAFRFLRRLERHEATLVEGLEKLQAAVAAFVPGTPLADEGGLGVSAEAFLKEIDSTKKTVQTTDRTLTVDDTDKLSLEWQRRAAELIAKGYLAHRERLKGRYGLSFESVGSSVEGGTLLMLRSRSLEPRGAFTGAVLIAQGEGGRLSDDVREFIGRAPSLRRLAVVHVLHSPGDATALAARQAHWTTQLADEMRRPTPDGQARALIVDAVPLDEGWPRDRLADRWGDKLAKRLLLHAMWAGPALTAATPTAPDITAFLATAHQTNDQNPPPHARSFIEVVAEWLKSDQRLLHVVSDGHSLGDANLCLAGLSRIDLPEVVGVVWQGEPARDFVQNVSRRLLLAAGGSVLDEEDRLLDMVQTMLDEEGTLIPIFVPDSSQMDSGAGGAWKQISELIGLHGRAIVVAPSSWGLHVLAEVKKTMIEVRLPRG
jgi:hypothetical protein